MRADVGVLAWADFEDVSGGPGSDFSHFRPENSILRDVNRLTNRQIEAAFRLALALLARFEGRKVELLLAVFLAQGSSQFDHAPCFSLSPPLPPKNCA